MNIESNIIKIIKQLDKIFVTLSEEYQVDQPKYQAYLMMNMRCLTLGKI